jgi:hypothetical protein
LLPPFGPAKIHKWHDDDLEFQADRELRRLSDTLRRYSQAPPPLSSSSIRFDADTPVTLSPGRAAVVVVFNDSLGSFVVRATASPKDC